MTDRKSRPEIPLNRQPLQKVARKWLQSPNPQSPYLVQLLIEAFESPQEIPGPMNRYRWEMSEAASLLSSPTADPKRVVAYLLSNPELGSRREQEASLTQTLQTASDREDAQASLLEWYADLKQMTDPEFALAESELPA